MSSSSNPKPSKGDSIARHPTAYIRRNLTIPLKPSKENEDRGTPNESRSMKALKHLFCGGVAGCAAKTITAPLSRLTILYQVHSLVTTKENRPRYAMTFTDGFKKIVERGGILSLWKGNGTSVLHRFPFSAINFYVYENVLDALHKRRGENEDPPPLVRMVAGGLAGCSACVACYPLDLVRTRLTTELPGNEHYKGITDAVSKIVKYEGVGGLYAGLGPTLFVAIPNFAISYTVYGSLKEYVLDDDLFYNLRKVDDESGEQSLGFRLTLFCGAASGTLSTLVTYPFDTIRRRMQIQNLHLEEAERLSSTQQIRRIMKSEGSKGLYRGLTLELLKVVPMVGTMFTVYDFLKQHLNIDVKR